MDLLKTPNELAKIALRKRQMIIGMTAHAKSGHLTSSMSPVEIVTALYDGFGIFNPKNPRDPEMNQAVWSVGHHSALLYATAVTLGVAAEHDAITGFRQLNTPFQGHPHTSDLPGFIAASTGALGIGPSVANGIAIRLNHLYSANKIDRLPMVFCLAGDGEMQEGNVDEARRSAAHDGLKNVCLIVIRNRYQSDGAVDDIMKLGDLDKIYQATGWEALTIDGHSYNEIIPALRHAFNVSNRKAPLLIIANTVKGKGIASIEGPLGSHGLPAAEETAAQYKSELCLIGGDDND